MTLQELVRKIIPVTPNEQKCALDRQMREQMRKDTEGLIKSWTAGKVFDKDGNIMHDPFRLWRALDVYPADVPISEYIWISDGAGGSIGFKTAEEARKYVNDQATKKAI